MIILVFIKKKKKILISTTAVILEMTFFLPQVQLNLSTRHELNDFAVVFVLSSSSVMIHQIILPINQISYR